MLNNVVVGSTTVSSLSSAAGKSVFTVLATDPENDQLQYNMTSSTSNDPPFTINQNSKYETY